MATNILQTVREDDYVEYFIFPPPKNNELEDEGTYLYNYMTKVKDVVSNYTNEYLWHKDKFNVIPRETVNNILIREEFKSNERIPPHIYGILHFGDNIEDEWFVVFLLFELTRKIDDLIVRVVDSDGEFLLIEAANFLPKWANPDTCEKRVYLYQGKIHLIPMNYANIRKEITVQEALSIIRQEPLLTEATTRIQMAVCRRIKEYPEKLKDLFHRLKVYLPVGIAAILNEKPELIAPAVLAFCNRDPIDMKACRAMKYFPPENRVYTTVVFTKCLYAMLQNTSYNPEQKIGWNLPDSKNPQYKAHILGVKIACGFEILAAQSKPNDIESDKSWKQYLKNLKDKKYFRDYIEGSQEHSNLLNKAKEYYIEQKIFSTNYSDIGREIVELHNHIEYNIEDFKKKESSLPKDDDELWLKIIPKDLDKMLEECYGPNSFKINRAEANSLSNKLTEFLDNVSSFEGAEFPNKNEESLPPVRPQRKKDKVDNDTKINFDPATFSCAVQNILDLAIPEDSWDLESGSEMSEYGDESESEFENSSKMKKYMDEMDRELSKTTIGQSFEKKPAEDNFNDIESFQPVDIDMNALKNILQSYQSEMGASGPASNMLGPMGIHLEPSNSQNKE